jgi:hypothetical protein
MRDGLLSFFFSFFAPPAGPPALYLVSSPLITDHISASIHLDSCMTTKEMQSVRDGSL